MRVLAVAAMAAQAFHLLDLAVRAFGAREAFRAHPDAAREIVAAIHYHEGWS